MTSDYAPRAAVGNLIGSFLDGETDGAESDRGAATASADTARGNESDEMLATVQPVKASANDGSIEKASNVDDTPELLDNKGLIIRSWTPSTSHLLTATASSISSVSSAPPPYFDVLDHVLGPSLPSQILQELQALSKDGIISDLRPARTAMEVKLDKLVALLGSFALDGGDGSSAGSASATASSGSAGSSDTGTAAMTAASTDTNVRGDKSAFVPRSLHRPSQNVNYGHFAQLCPGLTNLIASIEQTAIRKLAPAIQIDDNMTSVQIASYPGDSSSGYPRHCDRGDRCAKEPMESISREVKDQGGNTSAYKRIVTAVYYLTPNDWDGDLDGGALRVYAPGPPLPSNSDGEEAADIGYDVVPYSDRLVVFRSDLIEHEVMPSLRRDRTAITVWLYGRSTVADRGEGAKHSGNIGVAITALKEEGASKRSIRATPRNPPPHLPISEASTKQKETAPRIFVSIPSYRDPETNRTILSMFETAKYPQRVYVGVVWQIDTSSENADAACFQHDLPRPWSETNVRELKLDYRHATGPCLARAMAQNLHRDEEYILQIDSHMRFRANWDVYLLNQLSKCPNKSVLTSYPPAYVLDAEGEAECVSNETRGTILVPWKFSDGMLRQKGRLLCNSGSKSKSELEDSVNDNVTCPLYAAGFNFSSSSVIKDCPYDATLHHLFFGEEMSMAVRLFTHGYDFFAPPQSVCYHKWTRDHRRTIQDDTGTSSTEKEASKNKTTAPMPQQQRQRSLDIVRNQLHGNSPSLGSIRTASEFASRVGVDFRGEIIHPGAEDCGLPSDSFAPSLSLSEAAGISNTDIEDSTGGNNDNIVALVSSFLSAAGMSD